MGQPRGLRALDTPITSPPAIQATLKAADVATPVVGSALMRLGFSGFGRLPGSDPESRSDDSARLISYERLARAAGGQMPRGVAL